MATEGFVSAWSKFFDAHLVKYGVLDIELLCRRCFDILFILKYVATKKFPESWEKVKITWHLMVQIFQQKILQGSPNRSESGWSRVVIEEQHTPSSSVNSPTWRRLMATLVALFKVALTVAILFRKLTNNKPFWSQSTAAITYSRQHDLQKGMWGTRMFPVHTRTFLFWGDMANHASSPATVPSSATLWHKLSIITLSPWTSINWRWISAAGTFFHI